MVWGFGGYCVRERAYFRIIIPYLTMFASSCPLALLVRQSIFFFIHHNNFRLRVCI